MKKLIFTLMVISAPAVLFAQGLGIGLKGGVNFANVAWEDVNTSSITSWHIGGYININFSERFGITPEVLWTGQGTERDNATLNTNYIAVPVMLRFKVIPVIFLEAGPQFSFLTNVDDDDLDIEDQLKDNDFGLALGAGLNLPLGFNAGARYIWGFTNIHEVSGEEIKNKTFQIYVGWTIFGEK